MVSAGLLRLATNPNIFATPMPIKAAVAFVDSLLAVPVAMEELGREWPTLRQIGCELGLAAISITDAWIAGTVRPIGSHLVTFD